MIGESIKAVFKDGVFVPQQPVAIDNGSTVEIVVRSSKLRSAVVTEPDERQRILDRLLDRMDRNPLPVPASSLTRESLHERS